MGKPFEKRFPQAHLWNTSYWIKVKKRGLLLRSFPHFLYIDFLRQCHLKSEVVADFESALVLFDKSRFCRGNSGNKELRERFVIEKSGFL